MPDVPSQNGDKDADKIGPKTDAGNTGGKKESKIDRQIRKAGLPTGGAYPFDPQLETDKKGRPIIKRAYPTHGRRKDKRGFVDKKGRIWVRDRAHGKYPDHWDVQEDGGKKYTRVDRKGNVLL